jgi:hypothetical protein
MIFDSKRRQTREAEAEAEAVALDEAPYVASSVAPDDMRAPPVGAQRVADRGNYSEDGQPIERVSDAWADEPIAPGGAEPPRDRAVMRAGTQIGDRVDAKRNDDLDDLDPVLPTDIAEDFRRGWDAVQIGFVDDPQQAVRDADQLVNRVLRSLSETFSGERSRVEAQGEQAGSNSTEEMRVAMRRYRAFLNRLLSV